MQRRTDVQDLSAILLELCKGRATNIERALQIDINHSSKSVRRQLLRGTKKVSRSAVHDDIDLAELLDSLRHCFFNVFRLAHVSSDGDRVAAIIVDRLCSRLKVVQLATNEGDTRSCFGE